MGWNYYGNIRRKVGCILRLSALPKEIRSRVPRGHEFDYVTVVARSKGRATLHLWSHLPGDFNKKYTVTVMSLPEDPRWVIDR